MTKVRLLRYCGGSVTVLRRLVLSAKFGRLYSVWRRLMVSQRVSLPRVPDYMDYWEVEQLPQSTSGVLYTQYCL